MRSHLYLAVICIAIVHGGCGKDSPAQPPAAASAPPPVTPSGGTTAPATTPAPLKFITTKDLVARTTAVSSSSWDFTIIDARTRVEYADQHIDGALSIPAEQTAQSLPKAVPAKDRLLIFYCNGPTCTKSQAGARKAIEVGYSNVLEYNEGMPAWEQAKQQTAGTRLPPFDTPAIAAAELDKLVKANQIALVDVRIAREFPAFHVAGAVNIPLDEIEARLKELPSGPICIVDHAGHQATIAGRLLASLGKKDLKRLDGGMLAWQRAGLPVETAAAK
jgi:rhodanese-related sulfurtransferase